MSFSKNFILPPAVGSGFSIAGINSGDKLGYSVSSAGDVNHDGIDDLIVGANGFSGGAGAAYIIFGSSSLNASATFTLPPNTGQGFTITGISAGDDLGYSVSSAGDINNDGIDDLAVGATGFSGGTGSGTAYIIFGSSSLSSSATFTLPPMAGHGFYSTTSTGSDLGFSVSSAGDINNDGIADIVVGEIVLGTAANGAAYIIFGSSSLSSSATFALPPSAGHGFTIPGAGILNFLGYSVASAGDVNNDSISDIVLGAPGYSSIPGTAYIIFGSSLLNSISTFTLPPTSGNGFTITGISANDRLGASVASAGDINNDGINDLIVGANAVSSGAGAAYIIYGGSFLTSSTTFTLPPTTGQGFTISGISGSSLGAAVASAGDVNYDDIDDLVVGGNGFIDSAGVAYVIYGSSSLTSSATFTLPPTASQGFYVTGINDQYYLGSSVASAGDVNGDGVNDLVVGAYGFSTNTGAAYILFGIGLCPAGKYSATGSTPCTTAANGGFTNTQTGATTYTQCMPGYYNVGVGYGSSSCVSTACTPADAGSYATGPGATSETSCSAGTYSSTTGQSSCTTAANGGFTNTQTGATAYTQCAPGYYNAGVGYGASSSVSTACTPADAGSYTAGTGATSETSCAAGTYSSIAGQSICTTAANGGFTNTQTGATTYTQCPAGYYNPGVGYGASYSVATACIPAPVGSYVSCVGATSATLCPAGTSTSTIAQTSCMPVSCTVNPTVITITSAGNYTGTTHIDTFDISLPVNTNVTISGLTCANTYVVYPSSGSRISITDFNQSTDVINLNSFESVSGFSDLTITQGSAIVNLPASQKVIIQNLNPSDVNASNFIFGKPTSTPEHIVLPHGGSSESGILGITLGITAGVTLGMAAVVGMSIISIAGILGCRHTHDKALYVPETFAPNAHMHTMGDVAMILDHAH